METLVLDTHLAGFSSVAFQLEPLALWGAGDNEFLLKMVKEKKREKERKKRDQLRRVEDEQEQGQGDEEGRRGCW